MDATWSTINLEMHILKLYGKYIVLREKMIIYDTNYD